MIIAQIANQTNTDSDPDRDWTRFGDRYCMFLAAESFDFVGDSRGNPLVALRNLLRDHATTRRNQMSNKPAPNEPTGGNAGSSVSSAPLMRWGRTLACGCLTWLLTDVRIPAQD